MGAVYEHLEPLLLTYFNRNLAMDYYSHSLFFVECNNYKKCQDYVDTKREQSSTLHI